MAALWPRTAQAKAFNDSQIAKAQEEIKKMVDFKAEVDQALEQHAQHIATIESFVEDFAKRAESAVDPQTLQEVLDRIRAHTTRLAALMAKFPLIK